MTTVALCNEAPAENACPSIASLDEPSNEAKECNRVAATVMSELLDWTEWLWRETRETLAAIPNYRPAEWLFAYAMPADCASPIAVRAVEDAATSLPIAGPSTFPAQDAIPLRFTVSGTTLYTNVPNAILLYTSNTAPAKLPPLVRRAYVLELAARISFAIKKDHKLKQTLMQQAAYARQIAIADEANKRPRHDPIYVSDAEYARMGAYE